MSGRDPSTPEAEREVKKHARDWLNAYRANDDVTQFEVEILLEQALIKSGQMTPDESIFLIDESDDGRQLYLIIGGDEYSDPLNIDLKDTP